MTYLQAKGKTLQIHDFHPSDGSELIPAEVQSNIRHHRTQSLQIPSTSGYRIDDEGLINNYAIEPDIFLQKSPTPGQQGYAVLKSTALLLGITMVLVLMGLVVN